MIRRRTIAVDSSQEWLWFTSKVIFRIKNTLMKVIKNEHPVADSLTNNSLEEYLTNFFEYAFVWTKNQSINLTINYTDTYVSERLNLLYTNPKKSNKDENRKDNEEIKSLPNDLEIKFEIESKSDACVIAKKYQSSFLFIINNT